MDLIGSIILLTIDIGTFGIKKLKESYEWHRLCVDSVGKLNNDNQNIQTACYGPFENYLSYEFVVSSRVDLTMRLSNCYIWSFQIRLLLGNNTNNGSYADDSNINWPFA